MEETDDIPVVEAPNVSSNNVGFLRRDLEVDETLPVRESGC